MDKKTRLIILLVCIACFLVITPILVLYSMGDKFDFSKIKLPQSDYFAIEFVEIEFGQLYDIDNVTIKPIKTEHTVSSCGYVVSDGSGSILISADTAFCQEIVDEIDHNTAINSVILECSFPNSMKSIATISKHLTPESLVDFVEKFGRRVRIYVNHIKPSFEEEIVAELKRYGVFNENSILKDFDEVEF